MQTECNRLAKRTAFPAYSMDAKKCCCKEITMLAWSQHAFPFKKYLIFFNKNQSNAGVAKSAQAKEAVLLRFLRIFLPAGLIF